MDFLNIPSFFLINSFRFSVILKKKKKTNFPIPLQRTKKVKRFNRKMKNIYYKQKYTNEFTPQRGQISLK